MNSGEFRVKRLLSVGLGVHAVLISVGLIALISLLGGRAYSVGRAHFLESRDLLERDVPAEKLLFQIESAKVAIGQARKKLWITGDPVYSRVIAQARSSVALHRRQLSALRPEMAKGADLKTIERNIAVAREQRVRHARDSAQGLVRLIGIALGLSLLITAWLILLLYRGLMDPLKALNQATKRIKAGDLSARIEERGVAELRDLGRSFNAMATRLESLDQAKREFLTLISHELRNPMAALKEGLALLSSEVAEEKQLSEESRKRCISACAIASKRLEHMINNLLSLSRSELDAFKFELARNNLAAILQSSVTEVRPIAEKKGMQISVKCPPELTFSFNREGMGQAFVNLLLNAIKYGAESSTIEVLAEEAPGGPQAGPAGQVVRISVSNAGREILPQELGRIFDAFYRGENSGKQQGMGIGLHVVKRVVEAHRGFVSALSEAGHTRMIVTLPLLILLGCTAPAPKPAALAARDASARCAWLRSPAQCDYRGTDGSCRGHAMPQAFPANRTIKQIRRRIWHAKGDQVLVPKKLLERLLREEQSSRLACSRVSGQLEALKRIDVDGLHSFDR